MDRELCTECKYSEIYEEGIYCNGLDRWVGRCSEQRCVIETPTPQTKGADMNEKVWHEMFKNWIKDFNAIDLLQAHKIMNNEEIATLKNKLLVDIIVTMKSEVEE